MSRSLEALRADNAHLSQRANALSRELHNAQRTLKRVQVAEEGRTAAEAERDEARALAASLEAEVASLRSANRALSDQAARLQGRAEALAAIQAALEVR